MANLAILGHPTRGKEVIEILEMLGGYNTRCCRGYDAYAMYFINTNREIVKSAIEHSYARIFPLEEFLEKFPYKVGDKVTHNMGILMKIVQMYWDAECNVVRYDIQSPVDNNNKLKAMLPEHLQPYKEETFGECIEKTIQECLFGKKETMEEINIDRIGFNGDKAKLILPDGYEFKTEGKEVYVVKKQPCKEETMEDKGNISDGYHTFNELYEYRMLYNAALFNEFAKQGLYDVHKSRKHSDGEYPFGDSNWFIVMAELPTGQISNHYEMKDWDKFQIPEKPLANKWDEHSPRDVADRLTSFTNPKKEYSKTYEECCEVLGKTKAYQSVSGYKTELLEDFQKLLICRDAYWKIAGEEMGLGKSWEPDWKNPSERKYCIVNTEGNITKWVQKTTNKILAFPTEEMRAAFYENFKDLIESVKELL